MAAITVIGGWGWGEGGRVMESRDKLSRGGSEFTVSVEHPSRQVMKAVR